MLGNLIYGHTRGSNTQIFDKNDTEISVLRKWLPNLNHLIMQSNHKYIFSNKHDWWYFFFGVDLRGGYTFFRGSPMWIQRPQVRINCVHISLWLLCSIKWFKLGSYMRNVLVFWCHFWSKFVYLTSRGVHISDYPTLFCN